MSFKPLMIFTYTLMFVLYTGSIVGLLIKSNSQNKLLNSKIKIQTNYVTNVITITNNINPRVSLYPEGTFFIVWDNPPVKEDYTCTDDCNTTFCMTHYGDFEVDAKSYNTNNIREYAYTENNTNYFHGSYKDFVSSYDHSELLGRLEDFRQ